MHTLRSVTAQPVGLVLGFTIASLLFLAAFGLALTTGRVLATHDDPAVVHACVSTFTGQARFVPDGQAPNCAANETQLDLGGGGTLADVEERVMALEEQVPECLSDEDGTALFSGCDVQIVNGEGDTETTNGTGNLIVGYNEESFFGDDRTGSHNLVIGPQHSYSSYGGLVAGNDNTISGTSASVSGGAANEASGPQTSVSGGAFNIASGPQSSVSGGGNNEANGGSSSVSGGNNRTAPGPHDWVAGTLFEDN